MNKEDKAAFIAKCQGFLRPEQFLMDEPMRLHTTFEIGGPADFLIFPSTVEELQQVLRLIHEYELPLVILGNGSNVLVRDKGIRGAVVKFNGPMSSVRVEGNRLVAGAGALLKDVSAAAAAHSLTGLEFACGIPGSIGGAIFMNAGAYDGEMKNVADMVLADTPGEGGEYGDAVVESDAEVVAAQVFYDCAFGSYVVLLAHISLSVKWLFIIIVIIVFSILDSLPLFAPSLFKVVLMSSLAVVIEERAAELRHIVGHLLQDPDSLALCLRQRAEDGQVVHALAEQLADIGLPFLPLFCPFPLALSLVGHREVVFLLHTPAALTLVEPDGLTCYAAVTDVAVLRWTALVHILYSSLFTLSGSSFSAART